jgi:hypothetical protein
MASSKSSSRPSSGIASQMINEGRTHVEVISGFFLRRLPVSCFQCHNKHNPWWPREQLTVNAFDKRRGGLLHSIMHSDQRIIDDLIAWLVVIGAPSDWDICGGRINRRATFATEPRRIPDLGSALLTEHHPSNRAVTSTPTSQP